jgi:hypothetical protein
VSAQRPRTDIVQELKQGTGRFNPSLPVLKMAVTCFGLFTRLRLLISLSRGFDFGNTSQIPSIFIE